MKTGKKSVGSNLAIEHLVEVLERDLNGTAILIYPGGGYWSLYWAARSGGSCCLAELDWRDGHHSQGPRDRRPDEIVMSNFSHRFYRLLQP